MKITEKEGKGLVALGVAIGVGVMVGGAIGQLFESIVAGVVDPLIAGLFDSQSLSNEFSLVGDNPVRWGVVLLLTINVIVVAAVGMFILRWAGILSKMPKKSGEKAASSSDDSAKTKTTAKKSSSKTVTKSSSKKS